MCCSLWGRRVRHNWATELNWLNVLKNQKISHKNPFISFTIASEPPHSYHKGKLRSGWPLWMERTPRSPSLFAQAAPGKCLTQENPSRTWGLQPSRNSCKNELLTLEELITLKDSNLNIKDLSLLYLFTLFMFSRISENSVWCHLAIMYPAPQASLTSMSPDSMQP